MTPESTQPTARVATDTDDSLRAAVPSAAHAAGPGRMVVAARERAALSIDELAALTRLARATIVALECDDFAVLTEPVYVRGYYRKCAKVLNLPETELLGAYDRLLGPKAPPLPTKLLLGNSGSTMGSMNRRSGSNLPVVLAIAVALGVAGWLLSNGGGEPVPVISSTTTVPVSTPVAEPVPATVLEAQPTVPATEFTSPEAAAPAGEIAPASGDLPAATPSQTPATGPAPAPAAASAAPLTAPPVAAVAPASGSLVLHFRSSSWVRIEDADHRVLLSGTVPAGDRQVLNGRKPYSLFIGNAPGVTVEFEGQPFDLAPHVRQNSTARISLPYVAPVEAPTPAAAPVPNPVSTPVPAAR